MEKKTINNAASRSKPLVIDRTLNIPVSKVWQAFSDPTAFKKWWGPNDFTCPECRIEFKVGGTLHACMRDNNGKDTWSIGEFKELFHHKRIVVTDNFSDKEGNRVPAAEIGMPGNWPEECLITINLQDENGKTRINLIHEGIPEEMQSDCIQGWNECLDKMENI